MVNIFHQYYILGKVNHSWHMHSVFQVFFFLSCVTPCTVWRLDCWCTEHTWETHLLLMLAWRRQLHLYKGSQNLNKMQVMIQLAVSDCCCVTKFSLSPVYIWLKSSSFISCKCFVYVNVYTLITNWHFYGHFLLLRKCW